MARDQYTISLKSVARRIALEVLTQLPAVPRPVDVKLCIVCGDSVDNGHGHTMSAAFLTLQAAELARLRKQGQ